MSDETENYSWEIQNIRSSRIAVDSVITYVWNEILFATCGTRFIELYMLLELKQWNAPIVKFGLKIKDSYHSWTKRCGYNSENVEIKLEVYKINFIIKEINRKVIIITRIKKKNHHKEYTTYIHKVFTKKEYKIKTLDVTNPDHFLYLNNYSIFHKMVCTYHKIFLFYLFQISIEFNLLGTVLHILLMSLL